jgi:hypothetical protein
MIPFILTIAQQQRIVSFFVFPTLSIPHWADPLTVTEITARGAECHEKEVPGLS